MGASYRVRRPREKGKVMREFEQAVIDNRYRLRNLLDEGAFGGVFLASQLSFGLEMRDVAVKVAKRAMDESEARGVFGDALVMARLADSAHDVSLRRHFVTIHEASICSDGGPLAGRPYMVMELVEGGSLRKQLRGGALPMTRALAYFDQALSAVAFMHAGDPHSQARVQPLVHRDLKPANLLVERRPGVPDIVKVTDFGLAVRVDSLLGWVESGGDLAYLAPESFSHDISSPQSDVYMLALIFHEMVTGYNPFSEVGSHLRGTDEAKRLELRRLHLEARRVETFKRLEQNVEMRNRPALLKVLRQALNCDMNARKFGNAREFHVAWKGALAGTPPPPGTPWDEVMRLVGEAEQCFAVSDIVAGGARLDEAMRINRDPRLVPDAMVVGRAYQLMVDRLLLRGAREEAYQLAWEGYQRRKCRSTCLAMVAYCSQENAALAKQYQQEADSCRGKG